jgi:hypothetical protein
MTGALASIVMKKFARHKARFEQTVALTERSEARLVRSRAFSVEKQSLARPART